MDVTIDIESNLMKKTQEDESGRHPNPEIKRMMLVLHRIIFCSPAAADEHVILQEERVCDDSSPICQDLLLVPFMILLTVTSVWATVNAYPDIRQMLIQFSGVGGVLGLWCIAALNYETNAKRRRRLEVMQVLFFSMGFLGLLIEVLESSLSFYVNLTVSTVLSTIFAICLFYVIKLFKKYKRSQR